MSSAFWDGHQRDMENPEYAREFEAALRERIAAEIEAVDPIDWALAGEHSGTIAANIARGES